MLEVAKVAVPLTLPLLATLCGIGGVYREEKSKALSGK